MRVAYDAGPLLGSRTGVGRYASELATALEARGISLQRYAISWSAPRSEQVRRWRLPARVVQEAWRRFDAPVPRGLVGGADVVHATNFVLPPTGALRGVVTIHDLSFLRDDVFPGGERLRELVPWSLRHAAAAVTPTATIANELASRYEYPLERITVTSEGVSPVFFGARPLSELALGRMGIPGPFVLAVGTLEPRKNLSGLVDAWNASKLRLEGWTLVLAGPKGWGPDLPPTEGVMPIGYVGDETLPGLMAAADVFCYPSHYEGFGLPPLESMAAGTACIAGRYSAAEEVLGDAAILVDPNDSDALRDALLRLVGDATLRERLARSGKAHAAGYTWDETAAGTARVYESVIST
ncbi:MAG: glycosyltransferase family 4 protein [Actinomycetota bacterium]|nr:glycosyltransferase family 4 protein [Actinomycetota bacterium]